MLRGVSREFKFAALDPRPCVNSPALTPAVYVANPSDGFFDQTAYCGAFNSTDLWCDGWTKLSQMGLPDPTHDHVPGKCSRYFQREL